MLRRTLGRIAIIGFVIAGSLQAVSAAAPQYDDYAYVKVYYTDGTRQQVAGRETLYCDGRTESFGTETAFFRYYNGLCP